MTVAVVAACDALIPALQACTSTIQADREEETPGRAMDLKDAEREIYRSHGLGDFAKIP